ncbi:hypothetical protein FOA52_003812 [Chlamydomonas sp. UWO 241]|nr:hypothetical protein FOA52_003812 [Chlamydomonas sp. UWO 241]
MNCYVLPKDHWGRCQGLPGLAAKNAVQEFLPDASSIIDYSTQVAVRKRLLPTMNFTTCLFNSTWKRDSGFDGD